MLENSTINVSPAQQAAVVGGSSSQTLHKTIRID